MPHPFDSAIALTREGEGRFSGRLTKTPFTVSVREMRSGKSVRHR